MNHNDFDALYKILADPEIMQHYPYSFDEEKVRDWTFKNTPFQQIFSYMKYTNEPSAKTALSWGCHLVDEFEDEVNERTKVFMISREEWNKKIKFFANLF